MIHPPRDSAAAEAVAPGETVPGGAMADTSTWTAGETFAPPTVVGYAPLLVLTEIRTGTHPESRSAMHGSSCVSSPRPRTLRRAHPR